MPAISIQPTYPVFTGADGLPLENGYIWIGEANLDPQGNPITVYWDAALTIAAAQPIRTLAGYPSRSGTPARVYVNSDYSIRVQDKNASTVYSAPQATERISSDLVTYQPPFTTGVATTVQDKLAQTVSVKDFGAVGDGVADDTAAIQAALVFTRLQGGESRKLYWTSGTYKVTQSLICGTNQCCEFDPGVVVNFVPPTNIELTSLFVFSNQSNITFIGNGATLNGTKVGAVIEGNAAAFYVYGTDNVLIQNFNINNFATDGITITGDITGSGPCINVTVQDCVVTGCRRNGMSIISAIGMRVFGGLYQNTVGAPNGPWAGIDIEPNEDCFLEDIVLVGVITNENAGSGIQITPGAFSTPNGKRFHVNIFGGRSIRDGGPNAGAGLLFSNGNVQPNKIYGEITVNGFTVESPLCKGVDVRNWDADKCPRVILENITVFNPDSTGTAPSNLTRTAYVIYHDDTQVTPNNGNIILRNCLAEDTRSPPRMVFGGYIGGTAGKSVKNVKIENPTTINQLSTSKSDFHTDATTATLVDVDVVYPSPKPLTVAGSGAIGVFGGRRLTPVVSNAAFTLPLASLCVGLHYELQNLDGITNSTLALQTGDIILWYGRQVSGNIVLGIGGYVSIRSSAAGVWNVEAITGAWFQTGQNAPGQFQYGTAAPVTGTWGRGDIVKNITPTVGQPQGWICTVSGTPGTWVSEGNL